jgi:hypothetical protein
MLLRRHAVFAATLLIVLVATACTSAAAPTASPVPPTPTTAATPTLEPTEAPTSAPTEAPTPEPTEAPTPEPTEAATEPPKSEPTGAAATASLEVPAGDAWAASVTQYRGMDGERFFFSCPPDGAPHTVWGTDVYTDDSSVCTAGVHYGVITVEDGGVVIVEIAPGQDSYEGTLRNGITSLDYGPWGGSFLVITEP